jgi:hypothetical protein
LRHVLLAALNTDLLDRVGDAFRSFLSNALIPELADALFEPEVARLAALNATREDKKRLVDAQTEELLPVTETSARITQFQRVHHIIAEACQNHFYEAISKSMLRLTFNVVEAVDPDHEAALPGEHKESSAVIRSMPRRKAAMQKHLAKFCKADRDGDRIPPEKHRGGIKFSGPCDPKDISSAPARTRPRCFGGPETDAPGRTDARAGRLPAFGQSLRAQVALDAVSR